MMLRSGLVLLSTLALPLGAQVTPPKEAETRLREAIEEYRLGEYREAKEKLREAFRAGLPAREIHSIVPGIAALGLGVSEPSFVGDLHPEDDLGGFRFGKGVSLALLLACIEKRFGLLRGPEPDQWVDDAAGILVGKRPLLAKVRAAFVQPGRKHAFVATKARFLSMKPDVARAWAKDLKATGPELSRILTKEEIERLLRAMGDPKGGIRSVSSPIVTLTDGQVSVVSICTRTSYIEGYRLVPKGDGSVPEPVRRSVNDGAAAAVLPVIEGESRLLLGITTSVCRVKAIKEATVDLSPAVKALPIGVPDLDRDVGRSYVIEASDGDALLIGPVPGDVAPKGGGERTVTWLCLTAKVIDMMER